jgi:GxxExxY protein
LPQNTGCGVAISATKIPCGRNIAAQIRRPGAGAQFAITINMFHDTAGHEDLTEAIVGCGIRVHETWGPGLLESIYKSCLLIELHDAGLRVDSALRLRLHYKGHDPSAEFCPDLIVNESVVIELKAVERLVPVHTAQLITYLKLTGAPVGLLMNFNVAFLKQGIRRVVRPDLYVKKK